MISSPVSQTALLIDLVNRTKEGCHDAFAELVNRFHLRVRLVLARQIGNSAAADDLAQDVFLAAVQKISDLKDPERFESWLMSIARHKAIDHLRKQLRNPEFTSDNPEALVSREQLRRVGEPDWQRAAELQQALRECVASLNPRSRSLVDEYYFSDRSAEAIAEQRNRSSGSIRMALLRVRRTLADCIRSKLNRELER